MTEWRNVSLGSVLELKRGYDLPNASRKDGSVPVISSSGPTGFHSEAKVTGPGVVTGRYGTLGSVFYITEDFWPLNTSLYVRDFKGNNPRYVAELLRTMNLGQYDGAAAVPGLNRNQLHTVSVRVPDLRAQEAIGELAALFDELIDNNRRRVQVLEEMARAIYREWFLKFRYPGHESVPLVDSPLGPIPEKWQVQAASGAVQINPSIKIDRSIKHPFIAMGDVSESSMVCYPSETRSGSSGARFVNGDTLLARINPSLQNGKTGFVQSLEDGVVGLGSTEFIVMRGRTVGPAFTYCLARQDEFRRNAIASMVGASGRQRVRNECFDTYYLAVPPSTLSESFEAVAAPMFAEVDLLHRQARSLAAIRDLLLPKLVTGQIDVSLLDLDRVLLEEAVA